MDIKTRLSVQFTLSVLGILMVFCMLVYYFSYSSQLSTFRQNLLVRAQNTAILLINVQEVDSTLLKKIYLTTKSLEEEEIVLMYIFFSVSTPRFYVLWVMEKGGGKYDAYGGDQPLARARPDRERS